MIKSVVLEILPYSGIRFGLMLAVLWLVYCLTCVRSLKLHTNNYAVRCVKRRHNHIVGDKLSNALLSANNSLSGRNSRESKLVSSSAPPRLLMDSVMIRRSAIVMFEALWLLEF